MDNILAWGYPGLALCGFVAGSFIPLSSEAVLCAALALGWPAWPCILCTYIANWFGASTNYILGRYVPLARVVKLTHVSEEKIGRVQRFLENRGVWFAFFSFLPSVGNALVICYGIARTTFWKVGVLMAIGSFCRYLTCYLVTTGVISAWGA